MWRYPEGEASRTEVFAALGLKVDPFAPSQISIETDDVVRIRKIMSMAIKSSSMISVIGQRGMGKTQSIEAALEGLKKDVLLVEVHGSDKEQIRIGDIEQEVILTLTQETVARSRTVRARQLQRALGEASQTRNVVLLIEEAHRMAAQTLRSLKTLREVKWNGRGPLFTAVLVGQYEVFGRDRKTDEVRLRADTVRMRGLSEGEICEYLKLAVGDYFEVEAIEALARIPKAINYLDLQDMVVQCLAEALADGKKRVSVFEVYDRFGGGLRELIKITGISQKEIRDRLEIEHNMTPSKSSVSQAINSSYCGADETGAKLNQAIEAIVREAMDVQREQHMQRAANA